MAETEARRATERRNDGSGGPKRGTRLSATDARQGQIVLGRFGQILWIVIFALLIVGVAIWGF